MKFAESECAKEDLSAYKEKVYPTDTTILKKLTPNNNPKFQPAQDTKKVDFTPSDSTEQFIIGAGLSENRKARSSSSSVRIGTSSHGNLLTCRVSRENSMSTT